ATVEMNNTFYKMPVASDLRSWARQAPGTFRFALKAPQAITHRRRLKNAAGETRRFLRAAAVLERQLGPLLFQLPPNFKKDLPRLEAFLRLLRAQKRVAFEFRHASWFDDETIACLRNHSIALCTADAEKLPGGDPIRTADWGYVRLRRERYTTKSLASWIERLSSQGWKNAYVFFKHEDTGAGPKLAERFLKLAGA
ncbi:MAG: DUF72 domain-containing protein, partial [Planctomycetia bacterium]|nr:DUF72 domain-containing protein [Planctomycetia bacterium]